MARRRLNARGGRSGIGALPLLAGLLCASAFIRLGDGTGATLLAALSESGKAYAAEGSETGEDELSKILAALEVREAELDARAERLDVQEARLAEVQGRLDTQLAEIEAAEADLRHMLQMADTAAQDDLTRLATVYENMNPAEAGALFTEMPPDFAAGFMSMMKPAVAAQVMAQLDPPVAYAISVMLAGRHQDLPPSSTEVSSPTQPEQPR